MRLRWKSAGALGGALLVVGSMLAAYSPDDELRTSAVEAHQFSFPGAADYGSTAATASTLDGVAAWSPTFHLALGDFSYSDLSPEDWCSMVRTHVPTSIPVEIVAGNHEDFTPGPSGGRGTIDAYTGCLPDGLGGLTGEYGREYFFDYPPEQPLARFVMLTPGLVFPDGARRYTRGGPHFQWAASVIEDAHMQGIPWVIVGMHKPCLSMGVQRCGGTKDLMNMLLDKKVDLVLQGHDHTYQRTAQLALGPGCEALDPNQYQPECVSNRLPDGYTKGQGSVLVIVGTGGEAQTGIDPWGPAAAYFANGGGEPGAPVHGFLGVSVSGGALRAAFHPAPDTSFADEFTISQADAS